MGITKPLSQLSPGQRIGAYTIQRLIARGRRAEIYQATRTGAPDTYAVKVYLPGVIRGPAHAAQFTAEAARLAAFVHPHVARIVDYGCETGSELCYLVLEPVEGSTLRDSIAAHPSGYPRDELWRVFEPLADALASAHERGIVHGSLRPDHVLLGPHSRPALIDFCIPCLGDDTPGSHTAPPGVVAYWAPEQAALLAPSPAMDVYALGIMLYELAVGDVPFKAPTRDALVAQHLYEMPIPPGQRQPGLDPRIERAILIALRKNPAERFLSVREMLAILRSADADDYATLTLDKRLAREVRRRSHASALRDARDEAPAPESAPRPTPPHRTIRWWWIAAALALSVLAAAVLF